MSVPQQFIIIKVTDTFTEGLVKPEHSYKPNIKHKVKEKLIPVKP